jgi:hypothetical protein
MRSRRLERSFGVGELLDDHVEKEALNKNLGKRVEYKGLETMSTSRPTSSEAFSVESNGWFSPGVKTCFLVSGNSDTTGNAIKYAPTPIQKGIHRLIDIVTAASVGASSRVTW